LNLRLLLGFTALFSAFSGSASAAPPLVPASDKVGFSLDSDWQANWRRILDRHGRLDPVGPIQQRFAASVRPETNEAILVSEYALSDEWQWTESPGGARWWVHSYDALRLGTHVELKHEASINDTWRVRMRFDRLYTPSTKSDLVQGDFVWMPSETRGPYVSISFFPRIEKQDLDAGFTFGYRDSRYGDARLRLFALDPFSNGSYALAQGGDFDADPDTIVTKQTSLPIALAFELASVRLANLRFETYLGAVFPQHRDVYTDAFKTVRYQREAALMFGGLLEYRVPTAPLWVGASGLGFASDFSEHEPGDPDSARHVAEQTYQTRVYMLAVFNPNLRLETQIRYTARPEERASSDPADSGQRRDNEWIYHVRAQWLMSDRVGLDVAVFRTLRQVEGPPEVSVAGRALRLDLRALLHFERFLATFGVGINPLPGARGVYAGGGGNMAFRFD